jgi:AcrR family transcriptional regulator
MARLPAARRREQLLEVALGVFARQGFHQASMNEIAVAAGVTKPVLYQHFESKQELYLELLADVADKLQDAVLKATAEADGPRDQVERGFRAFFGWMADKPARFGLLFSGDTMRDPEFSRAAFATEHTTAQAIAELIAVDGMDDDHRLVLGLGLVGIVEVIGRQWMHGQIALGPDELAAQVADLAWRGLRGTRQV